MWLKLIESSNHNYFNFSFTHASETSGGLSVCCFVIHEIAVSRRHSGEVGFDLSSDSQKQELRKKKKKLYNGKFFKN